MLKHNIIPVLLMGLLFLSGCATKMAAINDMAEKSAINDMSVKDAIKSANFTPLLHASTAYKPGTCMLVKKQEPFDGVDYCPGLVYSGNKDTIVTEAAPIDMVQKLTRVFSLPAEDMDTLKRAVGTNHIKDISFRLKNIKIETMQEPNTKVQDPCCTKKLLNKGRTDLVTLKRSLKADVVYTVNIDDNAGLTVAAQKEMMKKIAADWKLKASDIKGNTIRAKNLYWGVDPTDDLYMPAHKPATGAWQTATTMFKKDRITCEGQHECFFCTYKKTFRLPKIVEENLFLELKLVDIVVGAIDYDGRHIINHNYASSKGVTFFQLLDDGFDIKIMSNNKTVKYDIDERNGNILISGIDCKHSYQQYEISVDIGANVRSTSYFPMQKKPGCTHNPNFDFTFQLISNR